MVVEPWYRYITNQMAVKTERFLALAIAGFEERHPTVAQVFHLRSTECIFEDNFIRTSELSEEHSSKKKIRLILMDAHIPFVVALHNNYTVRKVNHFCLWKVRTHLAAH
ncbi:hypothetical protein CRM22_009586 [Opisthorchis felineus]|uniref:Uncharacterized protein n=1 Tax=Opisthorchis felineus TaxID=147828 RepID=A0A4S2LDE0_OPIFE|nr:hypothetical protein CRM22_009586 [Opisthorchis felineus]